MPLLVVGGIGATLVLRANRTTPVTVDDAVASFRSASTTAPPAPARTVESTAPAPPTVAARAARLPELGVYVYATTGWESVDALSGTRREYPAETAMVVTADGCGVLSRWTVAAERWDGWRTCVVPEGITSTAYEAYHEFFGIGTNRSYLCDGDPRPVEAPAGATWTLVCSGDGDVSTQVGTVVGSVDVTVGGEQVRTQHVRIDVTPTGGSVGTQAIERWVVPETGLVVREQSATDTRQGTQVGRVHFQEQYRIELRSLTPQR